MTNDLKGSVRRCDDPACQRHTRCLPHRLPSDTDGVQWLCDRSAAVYERGGFRWTPCPTCGVRTPKGQPCCEGGS